MQKRISTLPFQGTKEQQEQLFKVIDENGGTHGSVMPILQKAQEIYGYLPIEVQCTAGRNIRCFYFLFVVCIDPKRKI